MISLNDFFKQYKNEGKSLSLYWRMYGGGKAFICSPYLLFSILFSLISMPQEKWYELPLSTLPDLLGFTLGGYAMLMAFGDAGFMKILSDRELKDEAGRSPFMIINGAFVHFAIIQIASILIGVFSKTHKLESGPIAFAGFVSYVYAIMTAVAVVLSVLNMSNWFDKWKAEKEE